VLTPEAGFLFHCSQTPNIQDVVVLIHRPPQVITLAVNGQKPLVKMPCVSGPRLPAPQPVRIVLTKLQTPLADSFISDVDTAFEQDRLHIEVAQGKAIVEPDTVADNLAWKAVIFVALGVGRRGHI
jgi:hypothetical protein